MIGETQVVDVVRAVANGYGDWADVPRCVREAVVLALAGPQSQVAQHINATSSAGGGAVTTTTTTTMTGGQRCRSPWPAPRGESRPVAPSLTEEALQSSVRTFADATWLRNEAVRSFAQFHNTIEAIREAMRHHLRFFWRTAIQLDPRFLNDIQQELRLGPQNNIPDGISVPNDTAQRLTGLEEIIDEIEEYVNALRGASVRFAATALSDDEKRAMGLDPADLRPEDVAPYCLPPKCKASVGNSAGSGTVSGENKMPSPSPPPSSHHRQEEKEQEKIQKSSGAIKATDKLSKSEVRERYMNQIALLNEASLRQVAEDVIACRLSSLSSANGGSAVLFPPSSGDSLS